MKIALALFVVSLALVAVSSSPAYTTKYDNIDLDKILKSDRLLNNYCNCLLGTGNCTPDGQELKKALPHAIKNDCEECSEKQKNGAKTVIEFLMEHKPEMWAKLKAVYDPEGKYEARHAEKQKAQS